MNAPITTGMNLKNEEWKRMRLRAIFEHCKWGVGCALARRFCRRWRLRRMRVRFFFWMSCEGWKRFEIRGGTLR